MGLEETLALTPALSPRRERPELCARLAPLNQPTAPSPRPSPPPRGRGCPKGGRGGGSWRGQGGGSRMVVAGQRFVGRVFQCRPGIEPFTHLGPLGDCRTPAA